MKQKFPKNFLWGAAYSSHQVEGNNDNNDWWEWEQKGKTKDKSGWACDSWNRYPVDHQLVEDLGCGGFRLSLEWSRIEPEEGKFSQEAIEHYRKVLQDLKKRKIKRVVTLWHWSLPLWFSHQYGWHKPQSVDFFVDYCRKVIEELGEEIDIFITFNEPRIPLNKGYLKADFPPGKRNPFAFRRARRNMIKAHKKCYDICKKRKIYAGLTQFCNDFDFSKKKGFFYRLVERVENRYNWDFYEKVQGKYDFVGINYYQGYEIGLLPNFIKKLGERKNDLGWGIHPEGLHEVVMDAWKKYQKPIYILENGLADKQDKYRADFIRDHLQWLRRSINEGADVRGYFHWSLIDNFEWAEGFEPRFGLCEMDYKTMKRKPRKSFYYYQKIIKDSGL